MVLFNCRLIIFLEGYILLLINSKKYIIYSYK
nr:MAG TPA: hypothetical protein [Caudoviricetes sp.]